MKVKEFQYINTLDSGSTSYQQDLINYFKIDTTKSIDDVGVELDKKLTIKPYDIKKKIFKLNRKKYRIETDFLECSYEQFARLDNLLAEMKNVENLHYLLAIYIRPYKWWRFNFQKYNIKNQDGLAEELLELDMDMAQSILLFFYQNAAKSLRYINIHSLNQIKMNMMEHIAKK